MEERRQLTAFDRRLTTAEDRTAPAMVAQQARACNRPRTDGSRSNPLIQKCSMIATRNIALGIHWLLLVTSIAGWAGGDTTGTSQPDSYPILIAT